MILQPAIKIDVTLGFKGKAKTLLAACVHFKDRLITFLRDKRQINITDPEQEITISPLDMALFQAFPQEVIAIITPSNKTNTASMSKK